MKLFLLSLLASSIAAQEEQVIVITGGWNGEVVLNSTEVLGGIPCKVPDLPENRELHYNALTADNLFLTIAGDVQSVLALDVASQTWTPHSFLEEGRYQASAISMPDGVYVLGGTDGDEASLSSSSFLATGSTEWQAGPTLPEGGLDSSCVVATSDTTFLIIGGRPNTRQVMEYDTASGAWSKWPLLSHGRYAHSCAKLGDNIVFSGGYGDDGYYLKSTSIIDITRDMRERPGGDMSVERTFHALVPEAGSIVAFGGDYGADYWDSVEDWDPATEQWTLRNQKMDSGRIYFGYASVIPASAVCQ